MENKKQAIVLSGVAIVALLALIIGATFAYFQATGNGGSTTNINVTTYTTDLLTFEMGGDIKINADQTSFAEGKGNATGSTFAKAILTANNKTNTATKNYYVYLNISENTFTYTQNENTPELLLTITDASGNTVTSISGLTYKTVTDGKGATIKGFDITSKTDLITLFDNREITANPTKTEQWNVTVTFVNYNANQTENAGKSFNAKLMIQQESQSNQTLAEYVISQYTGTQGDNGIYYHNSTLENGAGDNSYRYAGANPNNFVCFGSDATPCPEDNLYRIIGVFGNQVKLIKATIAKSNLLGTDGGYQSDTTYMWSTLRACPSSTAYNLYSGIYQLANKNTIAAADIGGCNEWKYSDLNTKNLNVNFPNNIGTTWVSKITTTTWKVGGSSYVNVLDEPATAYQYEVGSSASTTTYSAKVGLMYASDYYFAASPSAWTLIGGGIYDSSNSDGCYGCTKDYRAAISINWLYLGYDEWTITRDSSKLNYAIYVESAGSTLYNTVNNYKYGVRPTFFLEPSTTYVSGSGTMSDPIVIN